MSPYTCAVVRIGESPSGRHVHPEQLLLREIFVVSTITEIVWCPAFVVPLRQPHIVPIKVFFDYGVIIDVDGWHVTVTIVSVEQP